MRFSCVLPIVLVMAACGDPGDDRNADTIMTGGVRSAGADPITVTVADFGQLSWLIGSWRGVGGDGKPFYEAYSAVDDSTIRMRSYADSTFATVTDSSVILLRGGILANEGGNARWVATRLDTLGADFSPERGARNTFTWSRQSPTQWTATLRWNDERGRPQTVEYALQKMTR